MSLGYCTFLVHMREWALLVIYCCLISALPHPKTRTCTLDGGIAVPI
jgi:hypothetical protein